MARARWVRGTRVVERHRTARRILAYFRPHRRSLAAAVACTFAQTAAGLAPFLVVRALVDDLVRPHGSFGELFALAMAGVGLALLAALLGVLRTAITLRMASRIVMETRRQLMRHLLGQSVRFFTTVRGGDTLSRVLNDVRVVEAAVGDSAVALLGSLVTILVCVAVMLVVDWRLAVITVMLLPPLAVGLRRSGRPIHRVRQRLQERIAAVTAHTQEVLSVSGIMLVKSFGRERSERDRSDRLLEELRQSTVEAGMTSAWVGMGIQVIQSLAPITLLLAGALLVEHGTVSLGTVIAFVTVLVLRFGMALAAAGEGAVAVVSALPAWQRIFAILDDEPEIRELPHAGALERPRGEVCFRAVSYRYPGMARPAIDSLSLEVAPGELVALVGRSGAGKSTLTSLLARFYDPERGSVQIDGHDLQDLRLDAISAAIGLVLQETYLFHGTLRENLLYARPDASEEEVLAACHGAYLDELVAQLPDGVDTLVGERGHRLSGGERQRVAIARVILKDAPILILDEATSHLDTVSERFVQAALSSLFVGRTSFVIAHRLSTVLAADTIVVLEAGRIRERGTHSELLAGGGLYAHLYELQFGGLAREAVR